MIISAHTRTHITVDMVHAEIDTLLSGLPLESGTISDQAAVTIASLWQSPTTGRAFSALAHTGEVEASALLTDIGNAAQGQALAVGELQELMALFAWVTVQQAAQTPDPAPSTTTHAPADDCDGGPSCPWHSDRTHDDVAADDVHVFAPGSGPLPDSDPDACDVCGEDADHHNHNVPDPSLED